jgi:hypothetical protein
MVFKGSPMFPHPQLAIVAQGSLASPPLTLVAQENSVLHTPSRAHRHSSDNEELQRSLTFNPIYLTDGIQLSDDHS